VKRIGPLVISLEGEGASAQPAKNRSSATLKSPENPP